MSGRECASRTLTDGNRTLYALVTVRYFAIVQIANKTEYKSVFTCFGFKTTQINTVYTLYLK